MFAKSPNVHDLLEALLGAERCRKACACPNHWNWELGCFHPSQGRHVNKKQQLIGGTRDLEDHLFGWPCIAQRITNDLKLLAGLAWPCRPGQSAARDRPPRRCAFPKAVMNCDRKSLWLLDDSGCLSRGLKLNRLKGKARSVEIEIEGREEAYSAAQLCLLLTTW